MHFPLEAASKYVLAQVLPPASVSLIHGFGKETLGWGKLVLLSLLSPVVDIAD